MYGVNMVTIMLLRYHMTVTSSIIYINTSSVTMVTVVIGVYGW